MLATHRTGEGCVEGEGTAVCGHLAIGRLARTCAGLRTGDTRPGSCGPEVSGERGQGRWILAGGDLTRPVVPERRLDHVVAADPSSHVVDEGGIVAPGHLLTGRCHRAA